jgi:8-oxo-dGTP diphosphatase
VVEANESPRQACEREVWEETGLNLDRPRLLGIDYWRGDGQREENLQFIFHGGVLTHEEIGGIKLCERELNAHCFLGPERALPLLVNRLRTRVGSRLNVINGNQTLYLEHGQTVR